MTNNDDIKLESFHFEPLSPRNMDSKKFTSEPMSEGNFEEVSDVKKNFSSSNYSKDPSDMKMGEEGDIHVEQN